MAIGTLAVLTIVTIFGAPSALATFLENGCPKNFGIHLLLPHETDCNKFYQCSNGDKHLKNCAEGTYFNEAIQVCDWPWNVECRQVVTTPSTTTVGPSLPNGCPKDFSIHILLSHETDCNKFYQCSNGDRHLKSCDEGTFFNEAIQVCDWPWNVECRQVVTTPSTTTVGPSLPNGCPKDFSIHILLSHETDCNKFYQCSNGDRHLKSCAEGTFFNEAIQVCDWPWNVDCRQEVTSSSPATEGPYLPNGCPKDFSVHILLSHETDCSLFYQCSNGNKYLMSCADGALFNEAEQGCDWPWNVDCNQQLTTQTSIIPTTTAPSDISTTEVGQNTETEISQTETAKEVTLTTDTYKTTTTHLPTETTSGGVSTDLDSTATETSVWETTSIPDATTAENNDLTETTETTNGEVTTDFVSNTQETLVWETTSIPDTTTPENNDLTETTETTNGGVTTDIVSTTQETSVWETTSVPEATTVENNDLTETTETTNGEVTTDIVSNTQETLVWETTSIPDTTTPENNDLTETTETTNGGVTTDIVSTTQETPVWETTSVPDATTAENNDLTETTNGELATDLVSTTQETSAWETTPSLIETTTEDDSGITTETPICPTGVFGNIPHPTLCNAYYFCSSGREMLLYCAENFEFSPEARRCVAITGTGCTKIEPTTEPNVDDTTTSVQTPETAEASVVTETEITTTQITDTEETTTEFESTLPTVKSTEKTDEESTTETDVYEVTSDVGATTMVVEETTVYVTTETPVCPSGVFGNIPHPTLCNAYYFCSSGREMLLFCADNFEFNPEINRCVAITGAGCTKTEPSTESNSDATATQSTDNTVTETELTTDTLSTATQSTDNTVTETTTTEFDSTLAASITTTAIPESAENTVVDTTTEAIVSDEETATPIVEYTTTTEAPICPPGVFGNIPHPTLCNAYYFCSGGREMLLSCAVNYEYDPDSRRCVVITGAGCTKLEVTSEPYTDTTTTDDVVSTTVGPGGAESTTESESQTTLYPTSQETAPEIQPVPDSLEVVDVDASTESEVTEPTSSPEDDETTVAVTTEAPICASGVFGNIPHPTLCSAYYFCSGGREMLLTCADTFEFDPETRRCVTITENGCTHKTQEASNGDDDDDDENTKARIESPIHLDNKNDVHGEAAEEPLCPHGLSAYLPDTTSCNSYFLCYQKRAIKLFCANGFEFNTNIGRCVRMSSTGCSVDRNHI